MKKLVLLSGCGAIALASTGCVDSSNEILLQAPVVASCAEGQPLRGSSSGGASGTDSGTISTFGIGATGQQVQGTDSNKADFLGSGIKINVNLQNRLTDSSSYSPIGAQGPNLRQNQNGFNAKTLHVKTNVKGVKIKPKALSAHIPSGGSGTVVGVYLFDQTELESLRATAGGNSLEFVATLQVEGNLDGGTSLKSSVSRVNITINGGEITPTCNK